MRRLLLAMTRSTWGMIGTAMATLSASVFLTLFGIQLLGFHGGAYQGILAFVIVPSIFVVGLLLIPIGIWRQRSKGTVRAELPVIDLNRGHTRKMVLLVLVMTVVNVAILATATYKGVEVMDSTEFCGTACHTVMLPEFTTYSRSPHARVKCVSCHIGPGADWFVKSKLSGTWQLVAVSLDLHQRPIATPIHNLRPARETCEQCHWPSKFVGDRLKVISHFAEDEENTHLKTVLLMKVGGIQGRNSNGIHWHVDPANRIRYRSDDKRETIYEVEHTLPDGSVKAYSLADGGEGEEEAGESGEWRLMDCVDCHNRPTHIYRLPEQEVDLAFEQDRLPTSLPYLRREAVRLLRQEYTSHDDARAGISRGLLEFYGESYADLVQERRGAIDEAGKLLGDIYATNVYPSMNIEWGTYPNHIGHENFTGCFRCHDDEHATPEGETISQDCSTCHSLLAWDEEEPEVLEQLQP